MKTTASKSECWIIDAEMHEIGENVSLRECFVIPRGNIPNNRRKQLREQFMRRTHLLFKDSEHEPFCKKYMQLYNELRENSERLYWDEDYSKQLVVDHANFDSPEDDDEDFSPYRKGRMQFVQQQEDGSARNRQSETWRKLCQIRDKFAYDRERWMRDKAFPINAAEHSSDDSRPSFRNQPFGAQRYFSEDEED